MTGIFKNFEGTSFHLNFVEWLFFTFQILKVLHKFEFKCLRFKVALPTFKKIFAKLKFSPTLFKKIPSFDCLVFKMENK